MYFPYLRGRQTERLAIIESSGFLSAGRVVPILEPVSMDDRATNHFDRIADEGVKFALIVNSVNGTGGAPPKPRQVAKQLDALELSSPGFALPAFEIRSATPAKHLLQFASRFASHQCVLIHRNHSLSAGRLRGAIQSLSQRPVQVFEDGGSPLSIAGALPAVGTVVLRDGFKRRSPNASYPNISVFDDLLYTYKRRSFDGFSDFSIVGDWFTPPAGGPPSSVALHLTEIQGKGILTNHFVSRPPRTGNLKSQYLTALSLLVAHVRQMSGPQSSSHGVQEFLHCHSRKHFPMLGPPKKWSLMHHMEIIDGALKTAGSSPFI